MTQVVAYVELDALLDTRLGHLKTAYPEAFKTLNQKAYFGRISDELELYCEGLGIGQFKESYQHRGLLTLSNSMQSRLSMYLGELLLTSKIQSLGNVGDPRPDVELSVDVNHYPYNLTDGTKSLLAGAISRDFPPGVPLRWVNYSIDELTPELCVDRHYELLIIYHFSQWVEKHYGNPMYVPKAITNGAVLAPEIVKSFTEFQEKGILTNGKGESQNAFEANKFTLYPFFQLNFLPAAEFSMFTFEDSEDDTSKSAS